MSDICAPALNDIWNQEIITQKSFPNNLKQTDVIPVLKKVDASLLKKCRPVSVLPVVSKIYEKIMQKQILEHIDKHLYGYRKEYSTKTALISMLEEIMDLSKAFETINHQLLEGFNIRGASRIGPWIFAFQHLPK